MVYTLYEQNKWDKLSPKTVRANYGQPFLNFLSKVRVRAKNVYTGLGLTLLSWAHINISNYWHDRRRDPCRYRRHCFISAPWDSFGSCIYWLSTPSQYEKSGLVWSKYLRQSIFLLNPVASISFSPLALDSSTPDSIGVWVKLQFFISASSKIFRAYVSGSVLYLLRVDIPRSQDNMSTFQDHSSQIWTPSLPEFVDDSQVCSCDK